MATDTVSEVYQPPAHNVLQDEPFEGHYQTWGYSIGYEVDQEGQSVPEGGNTAVFRIHPHGMTEPVFVTKPERDATFSVRVLSGEGQFIRAKADGEVENIYLDKDAEVVIHPGEAYFYRNTDQFKDLVLHDVAMPAFQDGDDIDLTSSYVPENRPEPEENHLACVVKTPDGETITADLPAKFYEIYSRSLLPQEGTTVEELNTDLKFSTAFALGGLAMFGVGLYANYSALTGKNNGFDLLSWPAGLTTVGAGMGGAGVKSVFSQIKQRATLQKRAKAISEPK